MKIPWLFGVSILQVAESDLAFSIVEMHGTIREELRPQRPSVVALRDQQSALRAVLPALNPLYVQIVQMYKNKKRENGKTPVNSNGMTHFVY